MTDVDDLGDPNDLERWRCSCGRPNPGVINRCEKCGRGQYAKDSVVAEVRAHVAALAAALRAAESS